MDLRRRILFGAVSAAALACAGAGPAMAAEAPNSVEEVVVTGIRESLEKAIEIKRQSDNQVDAISAEDIGKLPDKNVADALQRIPGVNTTSAAGGEGGFDENDRVSIRGTSPSLQARVWRSGSRSLCAIQLSTWGPPGRRVPSSMR